MKLLAYALLLSVLAGCQNTAQGMKEDTQINQQKAAEGAKNFESGAKEAGKDLGAATILTPKIKVALDADKRLNDPKNVINVNSTDERVLLEGHVTSADLRSLAGEVAQKAMDDADAKQPLENKLQIKPAQ